MKEPLTNHPKPMNDYLYHYSGTYNEGRTSFHGVYAIGQLINTNEEFLLFAKKVGEDLKQEYKDIHISSVNLLNPMQAMRELEEEKS